VAEHDLGSGNRDRHSVGIWVGEPRRHTYDVRHDHDHRKTESADTNSPDRNGLIGSEERAPPSALMNTQDRDCLIDIYFGRLNPLLPIVDEATFRNSERKSQLVIYAMCLVASRDNKARRYLRFLESSEPLAPRIFASRVYACLRWGIQMERERDKINLIQILALLALYSEGPEGTVDASMHLSQAIHHGQTIGLHLGRSSGHGGSQTRLFWSLWVLSNFNAALNGRPRQILDLDIGLKLEEAYEISAPGTRILLAISQLLTRIIGLYQPTAALDIMGIEEDYESFENILDRCGAWDLDPNVISKHNSVHYHLSSLTILPSLLGDLLPRRSNHISPCPCDLSTTTPHTLKPTAGTLSLANRHNPPSHLSQESSTAAPYTLRHRPRRVHLLQPTPIRSQPDQTRSCP
jgi:hypothetical protein